MKSPPITREKIDELLRFLPALANPGPENESKNNGFQKQENGVYTMPYHQYPPVVEEFFRVAAQHCWCDFQYVPSQAGGMLEDDEVISSASLEQIKTLLTYCVRGERFCEGFWSAIIRDGRIGAILLRLSQLRDEVPEGASESATVGGRSSLLETQPHGRPVAAEIISPTEEERMASQRWKRIAIASLVLAVGSLAAVFVLYGKTARIMDDRLIGTWQSDADRTVAGIRERKPVDEKQEAALRTLFGKMRVTYTPTALTIDLDGKPETCRYAVLGKDKHSVVIREIKEKPSPLDGVMELSEFTTIQFEGPDSYWLYTQIGGIREYFKRVR